MPSIGTEKHSFGFSGSQDTHVFKDQPHVESDQTDLIQPGEL